MSTHVTPAEIRDFRERRLPWRRIEEVGAHLRECAACAALVFESREVRDAAAGVSADVAREPWRARLLAYAAAAVIAVVIAAVAFFAAARRPQPPVVRTPPRPTPAGHPWDPLVADALRRGAIDLPSSVRALRPVGEAVRGREAGNRGVRLVAPVGVAVESDRPELRWSAPRRAACEVKIVRDGRLVMSSGRLTARSWQPPQPLARGAQYEWQLVVAMHGSSFPVPSGDNPPALFRVIAEDEARTLAAARAAGDPLATGVVAARAGVADEALRQLERAADPRAKSIAASIRRW
jgi:hypothetical protein